jgi:predicted outer membrane repeat protein
MVTIDHCVSHDSGGGIVINSYNRFIMIRQIKVDNCSAVIGDGGALFIAHYNRHVDIINSTFSYDTASAGSAICIGSNNDNITLSMVTINHGFSHDSGGGIFIKSYNKYLVLRQIKVDNCSATYGGAIAVNFYNSHVDIINSTFSYDTASFGGAIYFSSNNDNIILSMVTFDHCIAHQFGGGIFVNSYNMHIVLRQIKVDDCSATYGGALLISNYNSHVDIIKSTFSYDTASFGGAIFIGSNNDNITLSMVTIDHCVAHQFGGGILIDSYNKYVVLRQIKVDDCSATYGGALYISNYNSHVDVVGSEFSGNTAKLYGGAIYVGDNCDDFMIIDVKGYDNKKTDQTLCVIQSDTIVFLDQNSNCPIDYYIDAMDINRRGVLENSFNPGITTAPLILSNGSISINYDSNQIYDILNQSCRRPKLISIPIINNSAHKCIFVKNSAHQSGGAIYFNTNNMFLKVINAEFRDNEVNLNGGAIDMEYGNQGAIFANLNMISNTAGKSGGAVYSLTNLGTKIYRSTFQSNHAGANGGAISFQVNDGK